MNRLREHFRRRSSSTSTNPAITPKSPTLNASERRRRSTQTSTHQAPVRRLYVTSSSSDFDTRILRRFQAEGFKVEHLPFVDTNGNPEKNRKELERLLHEREDDLEPGEKFAVVGMYPPIERVSREKDKKAHDLIKRTTAPPTTSSALTTNPQRPPTPSHAYAP